MAQGSSDSNLVEIWLQGLFSQSPTVTSYNITALECEIVLSRSHPVIYTQSSDPFEYISANPSSKTSE